MSNQFNLTKEHILLLQNAYAEFNSNMYYGAAAIDTKYPYGDYNVPESIAKILGIEYNDEDDELREKLLKIHRETGTALQIVLRTGSFQPGLYEHPKFEYTNWRLVE